MTPKRKFLAAMITAGFIWNSSAATLDIPPEIINEVQQHGTARIIVELDVPWQPEGMLRGADAVVAQRQQLTDTQQQFVTTLSQDLVNSGLFDAPNSADGTPIVKPEATYETIPYLVLEVSEATLPLVQQQTLTKGVTLDHADEPSLTQSLPLIGADKAWSAGYTGQGQQIAVLDTGVEKTHPFFATNRVVQEACFSATFCPDGQKQQVSAGAAVPCSYDAPNCLHGTHVAGIAASVAKDAQLIAVQVFSKQLGTAKSLQSDQLAALDWLQRTYGNPDSKLAAVNLSLGGGKFASACDDDPRKKAIDNLRSVGIATIVSSGNQGYSDGINAPACISSAISVGATDKTDTLWTSSNSSPLLQLLAPGVDIVSSVTGGGTLAKSGTSMAAPHVAGAWAVLKAAKPTATVDEVLTTLQSTGKAVTGKGVTKARVQLDKALSLPVATTATGCDVVKEGQILCLPLNGDAKDYSGNSNHGTIHGATLTTDRIGKPNSAYLFDGSSSYIQVADAQELRLSDTDFTLSAWVSETARNASYQDAIMVKTGWGSQNGWFFSILGSSGSYGTGYSFYNVSGGGDPYTKSASQVPLNTWHHHLLTYEKSQQQVKMYIDGVLNSKVSGIPAPNKNTANDLFIGKDSVDVYNGFYFHGMMDDLRIYNRAVSETEIQQLAGIQPPKCDGITTGLVACYPFDGNALDGSGNGNHGLIQGVVVPTQDRVGKPNAAYNLDGSSAYIQVPNSPSLNIAGNLTASIWIRSSGTAQFSALLWKKTLNSTSRVTGWQTFINSYEGNNWSMGVYDNWPFVAGGANSAKSPVDGKWHHLVAVYDWQTITIYTDGIKDKSVPYTKGMLPNDNPLYIGVNPDTWGSAYWGPRNFRGDLDDVRIYNRALSETEIKQLAGIEPAKVTLTVTKTGNGQVTGNGITCGTDCTEDLAPNTQVTLTATATTGAIFKQWTGDCTGTTATVTVTMDKAKSCSATFELLPVTYTLNVTKTGNGNVKGTGIDCGTDCTEANLAANTQVTLTATPDAGNQFAGWAGACTGTEATTTVTMTADQTCEAKFMPAGIPLTVKKADADKGRISGRLRGETTISLPCDSACQTASYNYPKDGVVILTATADPGYEFKTWSCTGSSYTPGTQPNIIKVTMTTETTCTANFDVLPGALNLTVNLIGTGMGTVTASKVGLECQGSQCSGVYAKDTKLTLTAKPNAFSNFLNWGGDCTGNSLKVTVTLTKNVTCTVQFQSLLETAAAELVNLLYTDGFLTNNADVASQFPLASNQDRLQEAFWLASTAILQADTHLAATQEWPTQLTGTQWYSKTPIGKYTQSIQLQPGESVDVRVKLLDQTGMEQEVVIVIYYGTTPPIPAGDGGSGRQSIPIYFPASFFARWYG